MRIVQVIYSLTQGGAERFVVDLSNELAKEDEVYLLTFRKDSEENNGFYKSEIADKVRYINLPLKKGFRFADVLTINKLILEINPDVIHAHSNAIYYFLLKSIFSNQTKVFHTIHNDAFFDGRKKIPSLIRKYFYKFKKVIPITISDKSNESFRQFYKMEVSSLIYNGRMRPSKTNLFNNVQHEIESIKKTSDDLVFIHISRFNETQKNHLLLLKVFNKLCQNYDNLVLIIIGRDYDKQEADKLLHIKNPQTFFLGNKVNVADYLYCSNAFCLTSNFEGLPISLLEALACGVVPICTPVGGIVDVVTDGKTGYLSEEINEESYYIAMEKFVKNPNKIQKKDLIELFETSFSIESCAKNHRQLYEEILNS
ncbi:glycosyltransferase [Shivajiella indica]|uniref:Glycosyltransferase n=1 Tax=Shivajiella indica TaxID=872115 RepID=A0ABW5BCQ3_9BACT